MSTDNKETSRPASGTRKRGTATSHSLLAKALRSLKRLQDKQHGVVESRDLDDTHRAALVDAGFLRPVVKGWYICSNPSDDESDSTVWYASFRAFVSGYLGKRFGKHYCLNPEASLLLHTGNMTVPSQVTAVTKTGGTTVINLPFKTSLLVYPDGKRVPKSRTEVRGLSSVRR